MSRYRHKVSNILVNEQFLKSREPRKNKKNIQKWIQFCRRMIQAGLTVHLYEARQTVSKYITVSHGDRSFKVRFSDHAPNYDRETAGDCDFFVGMTNLNTTTTGQAMQATLRHFGLRNRPSAHVDQICVVETEHVNAPA